MVWGVQKYRCHCVGSGRFPVGYHNGAGEELVQGELLFPKEEQASGETRRCWELMPATSIPSTTIQGHTKPKHLKVHTVTSKSYSVPMVPRDKNGQSVLPLLLPLNVGIMTVNYLGCSTSWRATPRWKRSITVPFSMVMVPNSKSLQIMADKPIIAGMATGAWSVVVRAANHIRNRQHSNSVV
ncbi:hypothetical protein EDB83DRAFT_2321211 [Lactarius deliciosus]|nr:hypothetical protein EDB83DRAFT_2321211 [Lactarius deliciosus]